MGCRLVDLVHDLNAHSIQESLDTPSCDVTECHSKAGKTKKKNSNNLQILISLIRGTIKYYLLIIIPRAKEIETFPSC